MKGLTVEQWGKCYEIGKRVNRTVESMMEDIEWLWGTTAYETIDDIIDELEEYYS